MKDTQYMIENMVPPHNREAETSILSSLLIDNESIVEINARPEWFYVPKNRTIFGEVLDMINENVSVDIVSLSERLRATGKIESCGGMSYIASLTDFPQSINLSYHCGILKKYYDLRRIVSMSHDMVKASMDDTGNPVEIVERAQREMLNIGQNIESVSHISDVMHGLMDKIAYMQDRRGEPSGIPTGFSYLDHHTSGFQDSDMILLGARPSMGKTALALNICKNIAFNCYPTLVFSLEMSKEQYAQRLLAECSSVDLRKIVSGGIKKDDHGMISNSASIVSDLPLFIEDNTNLTIDDMISMARKFKVKHGIRFICIDYIQLIRGWNKDGQGPKADISRSIKLMAKSLNLPVLAISQLNRSCEGRDNKRPHSADLREAGSLEQDADLIMFLYRDEVYKPTESNKGLAELIIRKNRQGTIGTINLTWIGQYQRFANRAL